MNVHVGDPSDNIVPVTILPDQPGFGQHFLIGNGDGLTVPMPPPPPNNTIYVPQIDVIESLFATRKGDTLIKILSDCSPEWLRNFRGLFGINLLMLCAQYGMPDLLDWLIEKGVDINHVNLTGETILDFAAWFPDYIIAEKLIRLGVSPNTFGINKKGTPLASACYRGNIEIVKLYLKNGADPHFVTAPGYNCLTYAAHTNNIEIVLYLLDNYTMDMTKQAKGRYFIDFLSDEYQRKVHAYILDSFFEMVSVLRCMGPECYFTILGHIYPFSDAQLHWLLHKKGEISGYRFIPGNLDEETMDFISDNLLAIRHNELAVSSI
jgi:hypothetical protein